MNLKLCLTLIVGLCSLQEMKAVSFASFFSNCSQVLSKAKPACNQDEPYYGLNNKQNIPHAIVGGIGLLSGSIVGWRWYKAKQAAVAAKARRLTQLEKDKLEEQAVRKQREEKEQEEHRAKMESELYNCTDSDNDDSIEKNPVAILNRDVPDAIGKMSKNGTYELGSWSATNRTLRGDLHKRMQEARNQGLANSPDMAPVYDFVNQQEMRLLHGIIKWGPEKTFYWKQEVGYVRDALGMSNKGISNEHM